MALLLAVIALFGYVEPLPPFPGFAPFGVPFGVPPMFGPHVRPPMPNGGGSDSVYSRAVDQLKTS